MKFEPFVRSAYNYDRDVASEDSGIDCGYDPVTGEVLVSMTKQSFAEEVDINTIVRRFNITGQLPQGVRMPTYGDFQDVPDYQSAMQAIRQADESFMMMPADVRARFHNDPAEFVEFCSVESNREEAVKLGLVVAKAAALAAAVPATGAVVAPAVPAVEPSSTGK